MREIAAMPFEDLVHLEEHPVKGKIESPSGRRYRIKTYSFWDMEPYESDLYIKTKVTGRGLRFFQRYSGVDTRGPDSDFAGASSDEPVVSPTWIEVFAWAIFVLLVIVVPISLVTLGVIFLISKIF